FEDSASYEVFRRIDKNTGFQDGRGQLGNNSGGGFNGHTTSALLAKDQSQDIGARFRGGERIREIREAADFNFDWHLIQPTFHLIGERTTLFSAFIHGTQTAR